MIISRDFLDKIKDFGINSYESKLWTALLSRGTATAGELSDIANVPRSRTYDVLESLERKGFVVMKLGKPIKYLAIPPTEVVSRVKKNFQEESDRKAALINNLKNSPMIDELSSLYQQGIDSVQPHDLSGAIKGRSNIYAHLANQIKNAKESICLCTTAKGISRKYESLLSALEKAKKKGVAIRIITSATKDNKKARESASSRADVRIMPSQSLRFCTIDSKQVIVMALDDTKTHPHYDFGIWISTPSFTRSFENIFDMLWAQSK